MNATPLKPTPLKPTALEQQKRRDNARPLRWSLYMVMIAVAVGSSAGRILLQFESDEPHPFRSANDRSRWATVRALVENQTYEIDDIIADPDWDTIDKVQHANKHGVERYYSSKPPILATMAAGVYWPIYHYEELKSWTTGSDSATENGGHAEVSADADERTADVSEHRFSVERYPYDVSAVILIFTNLLPWFVLLITIAKFADRYGTTTWGRMFVVASAAFGTYLSSFSIVLNNHLPAAASAAIAIYCTCRIWIDGEKKLRYFFLAGTFAAFTAAFELPGLALLGVLGLLCLIRGPGRTLLVGLPAAALVAAGFFGSNYAAHQTWEPAYMHRGELPVADQAHEEDAQSEPAQDEPAQHERDPDNWYDWEGSPWMDPNEVGLDAGVGSKKEYIIHSLVGHHGIFSLTPVWVLSLLGLLAMLLTGSGRRRMFALLLLVVAAVVLAFWILYLPLNVQNYGGTSAGFREAHWLTPILLVFLLPAADLFSKSRLLRFFALLLLIASVLSVTYNANNPWTHPWIFDWMIATGELPAELAL